jgi:hypothetical protein
MQALIKELATWFSKVMDDLYEEWPDHIDGVLMGCPIWPPCVAAAVWCCSPMGKAALISCAC